MRRPGPDVQIWSVQDRRGRGTNNPWVARWSVNQRQRTRSFPTKAAADSYLARLRVALEDGLRFDPHTGLPEAWADTGVSVAEWAVEWAQREWPTLVPNTRRSWAEALERALPVLVSPKAPAAPADLRAQVRRAVQPGGTVPAWLSRWSLSLADLDRAACAACHTQLGLKLDGDAGASSTASRYRKTIRQMLDAAVDAGHLTASPWPPARRGHAQRKASRKAKSAQAIDVRALPTPAEARKAIAAMRTHQPASAHYEMFAWIMYLAGPRPSEVLDLEVPDLYLPEHGWGWADVRTSSQDAGPEWTEPGEESGLPKTGRVRRVPLCPELVGLLAAHLDGRTDGPVVRISTYSNLTRSWHRARKTVGGSWRLYDLRHLHASLAVSAGAKLPAVAARLGHSLETLVAVYAHALPGDDEALNDLLEGVL